MTDPDTRFPLGTRVRTRSTNRTGTVFRVGVGIGDCTIGVLYDDIDGKPQGFATYAAKHLEIIAREPETGHQQEGLL